MNKKIDREYYSYIQQMSLKRTLTHEPFIKIQTKKLKYHYDLFSVVFKFVFVCINETSYLLYTRKRSNENKKILHHQHRASRVARYNKRLNLQRFYPLVKNILQCYRASYLVVNCALSPSPLTYQFLTLPNTHVYLLSGWMTEYRGKQHGTVFFNTALSHYNHY